MEEAPVGKAINIYYGFIGNIISNRLLDRIYAFGLTTPVSSW